MTKKSRTIKAIDLFDRQEWGRRKCRIHADKIFEHEQKGPHGYDVQSITRRLDNAGIRNTHIDLNELLFMT